MKNEFAVWYGATCQKCRLKMAVKGKRISDQRKKIFDRYLVR